MPTTWRASKLRRTATTIPCYKDNGELDMPPNKGLGLGVENDSCIIPDGSLNALATIGLYSGQYVGYSVPNF
jgi:hypothetical protein